MSHRSPQDPADRPPVGRMGISRDALRLALGHVDQAPQEAPGSLLVPVRAAHGVEEHPLAVDGAIERAPAPGDLHVGLVQGPGAAGVAAPLRAPPIREQRGEAKRPSQARIGSWLPSKPRWRTRRSATSRTPRLSRRRHPSSDWRFGCLSCDLSAEPEHRLARTGRANVHRRHRRAARCRSGRPGPATARCSPGFGDSVRSSVSASKGPVATEPDSWRSVNGVPVRSLHRRRQARQRNRLGAERGAPLRTARTGSASAEPRGGVQAAPLRRGRGCTVWTRQQRPLTIPRMRLAEASEP